MGFSRVSVVYVEFTRASGFGGLDLWLLYTIFGFRICRILVGHMYTIYIHTLARLVTIYLSYLSTYIYMCVYIYYTYIRSRTLEWSADMC